MNIDNRIIAAIVTGIFSLIVVFISYKLKSKYKNNNNSLNGLYYDPFFDSIQKILINTIPNNIKHYEPRKEKMFKDFLRIKMETIRDKLNKEIFENYPVREFKARQLKLVEEIKKESTEKIIKMNIPKIFIKSFNNWNASTLNNLLKIINDIGNSNIYNTLYLKKKTLLLYYNNMLRSFFFNFEKAANEFNGDLSEELNNINYGGKL